jgi:anti-sigma B factor antagonist
MSFTVVRDGDRVVISMSGQLVVGNRQELKQRVLDELAQGGRTFLIDFRQTAYIDSAGLGALVSAAKNIREQAGDVCLANLTDDLKTLIHLTKLDALFRIDDEGGGLAGRAARLRPPPPGPLEGTAEAESLDPSE